MNSKDTAGRTLVARIVGDMASRNLEPTAKEHELLALAAGLADQLDRLKATLAVEGYTHRLDSGRVVIHPAVAAINATSLALARVLGQVSMTELPAKDPVKQRAVQKRWSAHKPLSSVGRPVDGAAQG